MAHSRTCKEAVLPKSGLYQCEANANSTQVHTFPCPSQVTDKLSASGGCPAEAPTRIRYLSAAPMYQAIVRANHLPAPACLPIPAVYHW